MDGHVLLLNLNPAVEVGDRRYEGRAGGCPVNSDHAGAVPISAETDRGHE